jgi:endoglucanase
MKRFLTFVGLSYGFLSANATPAPITAIMGIRTASPTVLVAFFNSTNVTGPVWGTVYSTNEVAVTNLSQWTLNGVAVTAAHRFVTEANAVEYHIYLQVPPLTNGTTYTLNTPYGNTNFVFEDTNILCESIKVNQNGYSALSQVRYADFAIWLGDGGPQPISGPLPTYTVYNQFTGAQVASGTLVQFPGTPDTSSGDYVYRMDLSGLPPGGPYVISVSGYGCSWPFGVGGDFSRRLGYVAFRSLYYNRCGCPIVQPYAWANIRPYGCHTNVYDTETTAAETFPANTVKTTQPLLNVHGGYHDAGDADRLAYHLMVPIVLMTTYEVFPNLFSDNQFNIPDIFDASYNVVGQGNGIPDILDEAVWGTMLWTNLQYTPGEPSGAVAWGSNASGYPALGINYDQDTLLWGTETNDVNSCGLAAGVFMNLARLIKPYNPQASASLQARGDAAYNYVNSVPGWSMKTTHKLYYAIQKYLLTGDVTASNTINSLYQNTSGFPGSYNKEPGGFLVSGNIWLANYFMSYIIATNRPTNPTIVAYFKTQLKAAADNEVNWVNGDAYPVGWPANVSPFSSYNWAHGPLASQGQFAYPCLLQWALTGEQKYIDAVSQLMDYDQGLNPIGKCYMTGIGFDRVHNPHQGESTYAELTMGWGGPQPGIPVYGPSTNTAPPLALQVPPAQNLPRERMWVDDWGNYQWNEFTVCQSEVFPAAIYPVLAQGGAWSPAREPFLNPAASITVTNGVQLQLGGLPNQAYALQRASAVTGPWSTVPLAGSVHPDGTGMLHFTDPAPVTATRFYRAQIQGPPGQVY